MVDVDPKDCEKGEKPKDENEEAKTKATMRPTRYISGVVVVGGWVANTYIVMPLRGPTCKIARFQAELKFPSWTECGKKLGPSSNF